MPEFEVTYTVKEKKRNVTETIRVMALDETHLRTSFYAWAKDKLKKYVTIIYLKMI